MKIAVIVCTFPPYKGGMGNAAFGQARQLVRLGNEVVVFTPRYEKEQKKFENMEGVKVKRLTPVFKYGNGAFLPQIFGRLGEFDGVFLHYPFFGGSEIVWLWKLLNRKKRLVIQYHMDVIGKDLLGLFYRIYARTLMPWIVKSADKAICSSFDYARNSDACRLVDESWVEVPFGVDIREKRKKKEESRGETNLPLDAARGRRMLMNDTNDADKENPSDEWLVVSDEKIVLFVGGLDRAHCFKGVDILIKAVKIVCHTNDANEDGNYARRPSASPRANGGQANMRMEDVKCVIVGGGDMLEGYQRLVKEMGLEDVIEFAGRVSDEELADYYRRASVLVLPSVDRGEAFGMVLIEAMSFGLPVIASDLPGVRTVVDEGINPSASSGRCGFLVKPRDVEDLASKILWVLEHPEEAREMGRAGRRKAEEKYNWEKIGKELLRILHE